MIRPRRVAWAYVTRDVGNGDELLIGERNKAGDSLRQGQLAIPGGGLQVGETYPECAMRENLRESGVETEEPVIIGGHLFGIDNDKITAKTDVAGVVHIGYKDTGKRYVGRVIALAPIDFYQEPTEQEDSYLTKPRYIPVKSIDKEVIERFTPACQFLLKMLES